MRLALLLVAPWVLAGLIVASCAHAQVTSTRTTAYDFQCQDAAGAKISDHTRFDTAFVACLNAPNGVYVQGGRYRITKATVPDSGTANLSWTAPTQNTDGTSAQITGYRIVYGRAPDALSEAVQVGNVTSYTVTNLASGVWYFGIVALAGTAQSAVSNAASRAL